MSKREAYLGDGLYAKFDGYMLCIYAHNGIEATNTVWLEPAVLKALQYFLANQPTKETNP